MNPNRTCDFSPETRAKLEDAICTILDGTCKRVDISTDVKVYECKNTIRIDLKIREDG